MSFNPPVNPVVGIFVPSLWKGDIPCQGEDPLSHVTTACSQPFPPFPAPLPHLAGLPCIQTDLQLSSYGNWLTFLNVNLMTPKIFTF